MQRALHVARQVISDVSEDEARSGRRARVRVYCGEHDYCGEGEGGAEELRWGVYRERRGGQAGRHHGAAVVTRVVDGCACRCVKQCAYLMLDRVGHNEVVGQRAAGLTRVVAGWASGSGCTG